MGVHWSNNAAKNFVGQVEIVDLRTLLPYDEELIYSTIKKHGKVLLVTEESLHNSFVESLAGRIARDLFRHLDAPVQTVGAKNAPAVALNSGLEKAMLPNVEMIGEAIGKLLSW